MAYKLEMDQEGILRLWFEGNISTEEMEAFRADFTAFLEQSTEEKPLLVLSYSTSEAAKFSPGARKIFVQLNRDPRIGKAATLGVNRYTRVLAGFILKASGRDNVQFFDTEEEAVAWLRS